MGSVLSTWQANQWLDELVAGPNWIGLWGNTDPLLGAGGELFGGLYQRQSCTFSRPGSKSLVSTQEVVLGALEAAQVFYLVVLDARTSGHVRWRVDISANPLEVNSSGLVILAPGDLALTL